MGNNKKYLGLLLVFFLSLWTIKPLFTSGLFPMHDDTQVARVFEMGKSLKDGMFPVRWVADLGYGYGYPIFNFYAPLAYYVGGVFTLFGTDALLATKIMMGIGMLLAGIFMYIFLLKLTGEGGAILGALFYMFAPYHAVNMYVRGAIAELYAYAFIPIVFYGALMAAKEQKPRFIVFGALGYAGVILSHNLSAMMITPFLLFFVLLNYFLFNKKTTISFLYSISALIFGLLISSFYWLPALLEMKYTNVFSQIGGGADFRDHFVCINQLWNSQWGFGGSVPGCIDGMSFKLGKLHLLTVLTAFILLTAFVLRIRTSSLDNKYFRDVKMVAIFSFIGFFISMVIMLDVSKPVWETILPAAFIQYPWRFLLLGSFFASVIAGIMSTLLANKIIFRSHAILLRNVFIIGTIFILLYFNAKLFQPQTIIKKSVFDYTSEMAIKWTASKISDEYLPTEFNKPKDSSEIIKNKMVIDKKDGELYIRKNKTQILSAVINANKKTKILVNLAYFPAWEFYLDTKKVDPVLSNNRYYIFVPTGVHTVESRFASTAQQKIGNTLSIIGVLGLFIGIIYARRHE